MHSVKHKKLAKITDVFYEVTARLNKRICWAKWKAKA